MHQNDRVQLSARGQPIYISPFFISELWPEEEVILNNRLQNVYYFSSWVKLPGRAFASFPNVFTLRYRIILRTEVVWQPIFCHCALNCPFQVFFPILVWLRCWKESWKGLCQKSWAKEVVEGRINPTGALVDDFSSPSPPMTTPAKQGLVIYQAIIR